MGYRIISRPIFTFTFTCRLSDAVTYWFNENGVGVVYGGVYKLGTTSLLFRMPSYSYASYTRMFGGQCNV